jgi:Holliday junction resolvase RusA-like endonuclease
MEKTSSALPLPSTPFLQAVLPLPPSLNAMYKNVPGVGRVSTPELLWFKKEAPKWISKTQIVDWSIIQVIRESKESGQFPPLKLEIKFFFKTMWRRDTDNGIKPVQDAVLQYLALDDILVVDVSARKYKSAGEPYCKFRLLVTDLSGGEEW